MVISWFNILHKFSPLLIALAPLKLNLLHHHNSSSSSDDDDLELLSIKPNSHSYTSLKDLLLTMAVNLRS